MDDMNALERQLASVVHGAMRPPRPIDAASIVRTATSDDLSGRWSVITRRFRGGASAPVEGGFDMFSALKFVAAAAIVALFGGFLLTSVVGDRQESAPVPAAATGSPSPTSMARPLDLDGLITEMVEPGVLWVVYDSEREDLTELFDDTRRIVSGLDGSVWIVSGDGLFRLGGEGFDRDSTAPRVDDDADTDLAFAVGPDGIAWSIGQEREGQSHLYSFDGTSWTVRKRAPDGGEVIDVEIQPDGTVWTWWTDDGTSTTIERLDDGEWSTVAELDRVQRPNEDHPARLVAIGDDAIWAFVDGPPRLLRHDGTTWQEQPTPAAAEWMIQDRGVEGMTVAADGAIWIDTCIDRDFGGCLRGIARFDGSGWTEWTWTADPPRVEGVTELRPDGIQGIAPDGTLWFADRENGVVSFDGDTWNHYLAGLTGHSVDVGPDGTVWIQAGSVRWIADEQDHGSVETYFIRPPT